VNNEDRTEIEDYVTSSGTLNNCAGGATPWGTWLTWEEDRNINHGYVFEVYPNDPENELSGTPIRDMSFISHEAVDGDTVNRVMGMTPDGQVYAFASKRTSDGEFWGPTFAPDGKTFLVNIQNPGLTVAIWGPFKGRFRAA
jgi:secreted PhoX family phosphatase